MSIRVVQFGLGPIGCAVARQLAAREGFTIVGGIDIDPAKVGRDLGEVADVGRRLGIRVMADPATALKTARPDVVVLCTSSSLRAVVPQMEVVLRARRPIVSTTEELSYPWYRHRRLATKIDRRARQAGVAVLGTGVNPGFVMDALPIMMTGVCERVDAVRVDRVQDARVRRLSFQRKIGSGLTREQFQQQVAKGTVRHVGLAESIAMIADSIGWKLDRVTDEIAPKIAAHPVESDYLAVDRGYVCGIVQDGVGYRRGAPVIHLHMEAYLGAPESYDAIQIRGVPPVSMKLAGGIHGDVATASLVVNSIPSVLAAPPGLHTMRELPVPSFSTGRRRVRRRG